MNKIFIAALSIFMSITSVAAEKEDLANNYLTAFKDNNLDKAASLLHCPEFYTQEQLSKDRKSIPKTLAIFTDEFGSLKSYKLSHNNLYVSAMTACGTVEYWKKNKPTEKLVYETLHHNGKSGYIILSYSNINGKKVLAFASHGIPMLGNSSVTKIKNVYKRIKNKDT